MPAGRPSEYNETTARHICELLASGESLVSIADGKTFPVSSTIYSWLAKHPEFAEMYTRARETQMEAMAAEILEIADDKPVCEVPDPDGGVSVRVDAAGIQRNRLRVDTRKWLMSKLAPKKYGDKITAEHTGKDGGAIQIISTIPRPPKGE